MACTIGKALLFPSALEALGDIGYGLTTEVWWSPNHPFKSSLTGQTCQEIGDAFTAATGKQWTQPIMHYAVFEVVADAIKRAANIDDKQSILDAIKATDLDTMCGNVNWQAGEPQNPVPNVSKTPLVGGQWVKGDEVPLRSQDRRPTSRRPRSRRGKTSQPSRTERRTTRPYAP